MTPTGFPPFSLQRKQPPSDKTDTSHCSHVVDVMIPLDLSLRCSSNIWRPVCKQKPKLLLQKRIPDTHLLPPFALSCCCCPWFLVDKHLTQCYSFVNITHQVDTRVLVKSENETIGGNIATFEFCRASVHFIQTRTTTKQKTSPSKPLANTCV